MLTHSANHPLIDGSGTVRETAGGDVVLTGVGDVFRGGLGRETHPRWSYQFTPVEGGSTLVTQTYDCTRSPEGLRQAVQGGERWRPGMTATMEKLAARSAAALTAGEHRGHPPAGEAGPRSAISPAWVGVNPQRPK